MDKKVINLLDFLIRAPCYLSNIDKTYISKGEEGLVFSPGDASSLKKLIVSIMGDNYEFWPDIKER